MYMPRNKPIRDIKNSLNILSFFFVPRFQQQNYIQEFLEKSFSGCIAVFCEPQKWGKFGYEDSLLSDHDVWCTFGVHPHHSDDFDTEVYLTLLELLKRYETLLKPKFNNVKCTYVILVCISRYLMQIQMRIRPEYFAVIRYRNFPE